MTPHAENPTLITLLGERRALECEVIEVSEKALRVQARHARYCIAWIPRSALTPEPAYSYAGKAHAITAYRVADWLLRRGQPHQRRALGL